MESSSSFKSENTSTNVTSAARISNNLSYSSQLVVPNINFHPRFIRCNDLITSILAMKCHYLNDSFKIIHEDQFIIDQKVDKLVTVLSEIKREFTKREDDKIIIEAIYCKFYENLSQINCGNASFRVVFNDQLFLYKILVKFLATRKIIDFSPDFLQHISTCCYRLCFYISHFDILILRKLYINIRLFLDNFLNAADKFPLLISFWLNKSFHGILESGQFETNSQDSASVIIKYSTVPIYNLVFSYLYNLEKYDILYILEKLIAIYRKDRLVEQWFLKNSEALFNDLLRIPRRHLTQTKKINQFLKSVSNFYFILTTSPYGLSDELLQRFVLWIKTTIDAQNDSRVPLTPSILFRSLVQLASFENSKKYFLRIISIESIWSYILGLKGNAEYFEVIPFYNSLNSLFETNREVLVSLLTNSIENCNTLVSIDELRVQCYQILHGQEDYLLEKLLDRTKELHLITNYVLDKTNDLVKKLLDGLTSFFMNNPRENDYILRIHHHALLSIDLWQNNQYRFILMGLCQSYFHFHLITSSKEYKQKSEESFSQERYELISVKHTDWEQPFPNLKSGQQNLILFQKLLSDTYCYTKLRSVLQWKEESKSSLHVDNNL